MDWEGASTISKGKVLELPTRDTTIRAKTGLVTRECAQIVPSQPVAGSWKPQIKVRIDVALIAVASKRRALKLVDESCRGDRKIVLAAVQQHWETLKVAVGSCRNGSEIVLAAVQQNGLALKFAAESCRGDHAIVLTAVQQNLKALAFAAEHAKAILQLSWQLSNRT
eukprot:5819506-Amphidinium_carterae.1